MFEINPNKKIQGSKVESQEDKIPQQRAFLNEPQDTLELSTKKKKSVSFGAKIQDAIRTFFDFSFNPVSPKALKMLKDNGIVDDKYKPAFSIVSKDYENLTDMPATFQRKLAIDMHTGKPNSKEEVYQGMHKMADVFYDENGKPSEIHHYRLNTVAYSEKFEYAQKQDGTYVVSKENIYKYDRDGREVFDEEITFHKHKNGVVTISSSDGRGMSYSLRHETIKNYNNTPTPIVVPTEQPQPKTITHSDGTVEVVQPEKLFVTPTPNYPEKEYSLSYKAQIERKFDAMEKEYQAHMDELFAKDRHWLHEPVLEDLKKIKTLVLETKDPVLQDSIIKLLSEMKNNQVPNTSIGSYWHFDIHDNFSNLPKVYRIAQLSALLDNESAYFDKDNRFQTNLNEKFIYNGGGNSETFNTSDKIELNNYAESVVFNDKLTKVERKSKLDEAVHKKRFHALAVHASNVAYDVPELRKHLSETYIKPNLPDELRKSLEDIENVRGEIIFPYDGYILSYDTLKNFSKLPEEAKKHYLMHPDMCHAMYLRDNSLFGSETPYQALAGLSQEEWKLFEDRNIASILDVVTGFNVRDLREKTGTNIHKVLEMSNEQWKKLNDFNLLHIYDGKEAFSWQKNGNLKFTFEQMQDILDNLSYEEWDIANKRGLVGFKTNGFGETTNYSRNISTPILISASKVPDSTFNFLKNIKFFDVDNSECQMKITKEYEGGGYENLSKGIEFLSKSHNNVYQNVQTLVDNKIAPDIVLELVGISSQNYDRFGKYVTGKILEMKEKGIKDHELPETFTMYIDLQTIKNKSNINELSIEEKRSLLKNVIKYNTLLFSEKYSNLLDSPIVPKNKEEYCNLLPKLVKSIGIDTRPVTEEVIDGFNNAMKDMAEPTSEFLNTKFTKNEPKLELEYSRKEFIKDVQEQTKDLPDAEKMKVFDYFGFDLKHDREGNLQMHGYPVNLNNGVKLSEISDEKTKEIVEKVRSLVNKFSNDNKVQIDGKPELTKQINDILEFLPEIRTTIGKKQHKTHDLTVDVHTLKVLQGVMSDERYQNLSDEDKKILNIATILHDLTKAEGVDDKTHAPYSAYDAYHILDKMNMPEKDKLKVYQIIKNHEWLAKYNKKIKISPNEYREKTAVEKDKIAKDIAFELKDGNNFELAHILTKADLKGVKETNEFFDKYSVALNEATNKIKPLIDKIQNTAIHLPQAKLPKASELVVDGENVKEIVTKDKDGNEIRNKIIYLQPDMDLGALGFEKGLNSNDLNVFVHALDYDTQSATFQALGNVDSDSLLSCSYVNYKKGNYHVFRQQGFILDVNSSDIQAGTYRDFGSGYGKDLETLKSEYMFDGNRKGIRNFMSDIVKKKMKLSDEEYKKLYAEISDKSITELDKTNPKYAQAMRDIIEEMDIHKRSYGRDYNEWLVSKPKIQGVFLESSKYEYSSPPEFLAKYAADNDIPIIYFGK